jgi:sigma-E factor negative regulatory protein RseC
MLVETGRVVAVESDGLWVETIRQSTCGSCAARKGCGHGLLNRYAEGRRGYIRVLPGDAGIVDCKVNDQVRISIPEEVILRGSLVVYVVPLLCMLAGAALGATSVAGGSDSLAALGAAAGFGLGFALVRWHAWHHRNDRALQPTFLEVVDRPPTRAVDLA